VVLQEEESREDQQRTSHTSTSKPPPINAAGVQNISSIIQLLEQITNKQYELIKLAGNQAEVQPKTVVCYSTTVKALTGKRQEFHPYKLKEETSYRVY
jgi:hypothetical protein